MRAVTRHLIVGTLLVGAAVGLTANAVQPGRGIATEATVPVSSAPATETSPAPPASDLREESGSRSRDRIAPGDSVLAERRDQLAAQRSRIAQAAEELRQRQVARDGYDPRTATSPQEIARQIAANKFGWSGAQWTCYDLLIKSESNWDPYATNPSSGAYGIPQSLPGNKMASEGADWRTNPATQVKWGLRYVKETYGTPCGAWSFKQGHNWY